MTKFKAHNYRLLVEVEEVDEKVGSIVIAKATLDKEQKAQTYATVLHIGETAEVSDEVQVGSKIVIAQWAGVRPPGDKNTLLRIINDTDVCAIAYEADNDE